MRTKWKLEIVTVFESAEEGRANGGWYKDADEDTLKEIADAIKQGYREGMIIG